MKHVVLIAAMLVGAVELRGASAGYLTQPITGKVAVVVNRQKMLSRDALANAAAGVRAMLSIPIEIVDESALPSASGRMAMRMDVCEGGDAPMVSAVPDEAFGTINITALAKDSPAAALLEKRMEKQFWRAFSLALGVGYSPIQPDLLSRVRSVAELDALSERPGPQSYNQMMVEAENVGIQLIRYASYRRACEEGWAPAPTNDAQRVVWEKVRAEQSTLPVKGLKIKYDPAKGR